MVVDIKAYYLGVVIARPKLNLLYQRPLLSGHVNADSVTYDVKAFTYMYIHTHIHAQRYQTLHASSHLED